MGFFSRLVGGMNEDFVIGKDNVRRFEQAQAQPQLTRAERRALNPQPAPVSAPQYRAPVQQYVAPPQQRQVDENFQPVDWRDLKAQTEARHAAQPPGFAKRAGKGIAKFVAAAAVGVVAGAVIHEHENHKEGGTGTFF